MKDFFILLTLFIVLFIAFVPVTGLAENSTNLDKKDAQDSISVYGKYVENSEGIIYSVNINWGNMMFTYTEGTKGTWNPQTHDYDNPTPGSWHCDDGQDIIKITNHSNTDITIDLSFSANSLDTELKGTFGDSQFTLSTAEGTEVSNAPNKEVKLELEGSIDESFANKTSKEDSIIGFVSIKIS